MKYISLFSGIGAFEKALDNLGVRYELAAYCEIDKYASKSYAAIHNVPESLNLGDITKVDEKALPHDLDLCTYGFPCQDISISGRMRGLFDEDGKLTRSGLFFEALRIIEETQPRVAIAENVKNLTGQKFKIQFELVLKSLEDAGYNNYWKVLNLKDFGIPQNRERVFIVSIRKDIDNGAFTFPEGFPLNLRLKDILEDEVDERYYMSDKVMQGLTRRKELNSLLSTERVVTVGNTNPSGHGMNGNVISEEGLSSTLTTNKGEGLKILVGAEQKVIKVGNIYPSGGENGNIYLDEGLSPTLKAGTGVKGNGIGSNNAPKILLTTEPAVRQIGNCCPTKTRDNPNQGRVYDTDGLAPAPNCMGGGNRQPCIVDEGKAFAAAMRGRYNEQAEIEEQLFVSDRDYANAIVSTQPKASLVAYQSFVNGDICKTVRVGGRGSVDGNHSWDIVECKNTMRIRKLTPKECFRLMGFSDADHDKAAAVNSNTQLYKQAGNSIGVPCVEHIFKSLINSKILTRM